MISYKSKAVTLFVFTASFIQALAGGLACSTILSQSSWVGMGQYGSVMVPNVRITFNAALTEMTTTDPKDSRPITIPVQVNCEANNQFQLTYANNPSMLNLAGTITALAGKTAYSLVMLGTKKLYQKNREVPAKLVLSSK